jgi:hypothetical protein
VAKFFLSPYRLRGLTVLGLVIINQFLADRQQKGWNEGWFEFKDQSTNQQ